MRQRLDYIDIARGIGILFVIFSHSGGESGMMQYIGGFFIPLFFILSGYTYRQREVSLASFVGQKFRRLVKPYLLYSAFFLVLFRRWTLHDVVGVAYSRYCLFPFDAPENVYFMELGNAPMWFLTSMFTAYVAFELMMRSGRYRLAVAAGFGLLAFAFQFLPILLPWSLDTAPLMALFIAIGVVLREYEVLERFKPAHVFVAMVLFVALCQVNGLLNVSVREYGRSFVLLLMTGTIGTLIVLKVSQWMEHTWLSSVLASFGRHSMTIFCLQMLVIRLQNVVFFEVAGLPATPTVVLVTSLVKTVVTAVVGVYLSIGQAMLSGKWAKGQAILSSRLRKGRSR